MNNSPYARQRALSLSLMIHEMGIEGEEQAAQVLADNGFIVYFDRAHPAHEADCIVYPNIEIEVKSSRLRMVNQTKQGYQFGIYKAGRARRIHEPITILLCQTDPAPVPFIVPSNLIAHHSAVSIACVDPNAYRRKWSYFRNRFDFLIHAGAVVFENGFVTSDRALFEGLEVQNAN